VKRLAIALCVLACGPAPSTPAPVSSTPPPSLGEQLVPTVAGEPLEGTFEGAHAAAVTWTPVNGPPIALEIRGTGLYASYDSPLVGSIRDAMWPHGCGTAGPIRWSIACGDRLVLRCTSPQPWDQSSTALWWNAPMGELQLDLDCEP
jgi:hypothetical protein